jgi:hypothetical protein
MYVHKDKYSYIYKYLYLNCVSNKKKIIAKCAWPGWAQPGRVIRARLRREDNQSGWTSRSLVEFFFVTM